MSVRRDPRTGRWYFRARVTFPDGKRDRIFGTPGVPGPFHDLPNTKVGATTAEQRAITKSMGGAVLRPEPPKEVPTIQDYVATFLGGHGAAHKPGTRKDKRQRLDAYILPAVGHLRLDELRQEHVDRLVASLLGDEDDEDKASRKGINNTTSVLSSLIGYAVTNKVIADPGLKFNIKSTSAIVYPVAAEDVNKLLEVATDERYQVAILLAADAGLRIGEIRALHWMDVNELAREFTVVWSYDRDGNKTEPKSWERRTLPIAERLWAAMKKLQRRGPLVFSRLDGKPLGYDATIQVAHELYELAKVTKPLKPWHSLRHTFGTELASRTQDVKTIQDLMGHKSLETTMRYLHTTRERKRAAIALLGGAGSERAAAPKSELK